MGGILIGIRKDWILKDGFKVKRREQRRIETELKTQEGVLKF